MKQTNTYSRFDDPQHTPGNETTTAESGREWKVGIFDCFANWSICLVHRWGNIFLFIRSVNFLHLFRPSKHTWYTNSPPLTFNYSRSHLRESYCYDLHFKALEAICLSQIRIFQWSHHFIMFYSKNVSLDFLWPMVRKKT